VLKSLGSIQKIRAATVVQLSAVEGISPQLAGQIREFFHPGEKEPENS